MEIFAPEKIIYVIEFESGTLDDDDTKLNSIYNMMSRDKIRVFRTTGPAETSVFLMKFLDSCSKLEAGALSNITNLEAVTKSRGKTKTTESFYLGFLQSLPGVSAKTATLIAAKYANFDIFISTAKNNYDEIAELSLGKKRLGKATALKIHQTLFQAMSS
jgi:ERCC4-type nuclease